MCPPAPLGQLTLLPFEWVANKSSNLWPPFLIQLPAPRVHRLAYARRHIHPKIYWSGTGTLITIISEGQFYILRFDREAFNDALACGVEMLTKAS